MRRIFVIFVTVLGLAGFAAAAQVGCAGHMDMATTDSTTVATDSTPTKPVLPEQSGG